MADATVRASTGAMVTGASATQVFTFPGTPPPQVGDPITILGTINSTAFTIPSTPAGWTLDYMTDFGTAGRFRLSKVYASGDGTSVSVTFSATPNYAYAIVVFDGSAHSGFGAMGTVTTRASSSTTTTAAAAGTAGATTPSLVISHEKAGTHNTPPGSVSPASTVIQNIGQAATSTGSVVIASYDTTGGTASRTTTYLTATSNGAAYQVGLTAAAAPAGLPELVMAPRNFF